MRFILTRFFAVSALVCGGEYTSALPPSSDVHLTLSLSSLAAQYALAAPIAAPISDASIAPAVLSSGVDTAAAIVRVPPPPFKSLRH